MERPLVLYVLRQYPQITETYIDAEIRELSRDHDVEIISRNRALRSPSRVAHLHSFPYTTLEDPNEVVEAIRELRPRVLHSHWLFQLGDLLHLARATATPFTIRAHSFDTIESQDPRRVVQNWLRSCGPVLHEATADPLCLGVLAFPFSRPFLETRGVPPEKIHDCYPVIDYARFHDDSPNGEAVINTGACIPKKKMEDFLELGRRVKERRFDLYPVSYASMEIKALNERLGRPVHIADPVEPERMPAVYKEHAWMVYTACPRLHNIGWPLAVHEAMAAGVGVVLANVRPDLREYVGEAGFLYDSLDEAARLVRGPVPEEIRAAGFEQARRSDIARHRTLLTDLWRRAAA